jgi:phosphoserine phosphatase
MSNRFSSARPRSCFSDDREAPRRVQKGPSGPVAKLHVFDMDGTLLRGAAVEEISRHLGCFDEASALEQAWRRGEVVDEVMFWERVLEFWAKASDLDFDEAFERAPWMSRVPEVFADIAARGEHSVVISQSPLFIVRRLERWGVHATFATTVERGVQCHINQLLQPEHKVEITLDLVEKLGLSLSDCVAYGDSTSDVELFRKLQRTVAVNATAATRALAAKAYVGHDMWDAYQIGRQLLAEADAAEHRREDA